MKLFKKKGTRGGDVLDDVQALLVRLRGAAALALLGASLPFTLPTQMAGGAPSIQFATGLLYRPHTHELIVSYGEMDCHATLARFPLGATLDATLGRRKAAAPPMLLSPLKLTKAPNGSLVF